MATERRCHSCRCWFDAKASACPECGASRYAYSPHLDKARLDNHLFAQAESAEKERKQYAAIQAGYEIPPTKRQRKLARQIVSDM